MFVAPNGARFKLVEEDGYVKAVPENATWLFEVLDAMEPPPEKVKKKS